MFRNRKKLFILIFIFFTLPIFAAAQSGGGGGGDGGDSGPGIENPIQADTIQELIASILGIVVQIGTPIAALAIIYSGFLFVMARGNPEKINHAKETFLYAVIGTAILLGAFAISEIIQNTVNQVTSYETIHEISIYRS